MPLDDAYIHFQYAHQIAVGQPYVYNPGLPPTSGATSFLYPYLLAVGDLLGFRGLNLGVWAMGIGAVALAISAWLVYRIVRLTAPDWLALVFAAAFALDGWIEWHFMSGMETGVAILFTLLTLYAVLDRRLRLSVIAMTLLALIRPEGGLLAVIAAGIVLVSALREAPIKAQSGIFGRLGIPRPWLWRREWLLLLIPVLAVGVQPLVNLLLTGSAVASGNAAKSLFGIVGTDFGAIVGRVLDNFERMWREFLTQYLYIFALALVGWGAMLARKRWRLAAIMIALWLLAGTAAISTLDTAFWHFKRYQMPLIALFFPLAGWGWAFVYRQGQRWMRRLTLRELAPALVVVALIVGRRSGSVGEHVAVRGELRAQRRLRRRAAAANGALAGGEHAGGRAGRRSRRRHDALHRRAHDDRHRGPDDARRGGVLAQRSRLGGRVHRARAPGLHRLVW